MSSEFYKNKEETKLYKVTRTRILLLRNICKVNLPINVRTDYKRTEIYYNRVSLENLQITEAEYKELNTKLSLLHT